MSQPPSQPPSPSTTDILRDLQERIATLERNSADVDHDFANADRLFTHFETRVAELERRLDQLQPQLKQCASCHRILRSKDGVCEFCHHRNIEPAGSTR